MSDTVPGPPDRPEGVPPGLARERTVLAWQRTGLSLIAAGIAIAKGIPVVHGVPGRPALGIVMLVLGGALFAVSTGAARRRATGTTSTSTAQLGDLAPLALGTAVVAVAAFLVVALR